MSGLKESIEALLDLNDDVRRAFSDPLGEDGVYEYSVTLMKEVAGAYFFLMRKRCMRIR